MDEDDYNEVRKKPLKLTDSKKKKKHKKIKPSLEGGDDQVASTTSESPKMIVPIATKAEQAFKAKQDSIAQARILKKASKTHKQRVEEFNKHLDSLSEHYDIPKVSWTK